MTTNKAEFPDNYGITFDHADPKRLMQLKGKDYMTVQNRMLWFLRDQREFIKRGLATASYCIETRLIEIDHERGYAHFATYVRDVLGNEATMYGSEMQRDFGDFAEKASTKSLGRALLALGYGTAFAQEMDEGERVVDSPVERKRAASTTQPIAQTRSVNPNDGGGVSALNLDWEHLPVGTPPQTVADFAREKGLDGPAWGALWRKHQGALPAIWTELRTTLRAPVRAQV